MRDSEALEFDNLTRGTLKVCGTTAPMEERRRMGGMLRDTGLRLELLDRDATIEKEPLLATVADRIAGSIFSPACR